MVQVWEESLQNLVSFFFCFAYKMQQKATRKNKNRLESNTC